MSTLIVFDASAIVGAALKRDGKPRQALLKARREDVIALSSMVVAEIRSMLARPKFANALSDEDRTIVIALITDVAVWVEPIHRITDCRDEKDNKYLELAVAASAEIIVSSDDDLLALHPWREIRIVRPAGYLNG